jgi:L-seryl-tRNA(Ser) seleniumtransferase
MRMTGYCDLEMDLETGTRGGRIDGVRRLLKALTGAEDALVVNNCAAAVLLALTALARDREVLVSRGELVEIGGSFRVPDVITSGGCTLREVGTTNRTRRHDYASAVNDSTAVILSVHTSNFRVVGFTEATPREDLVSLGQERDLFVVEDVGSGSLDGIVDEPAVRAAVAAGVDVILFSGDKLLGGPQAGFAVGKREAIERLRRHPLYRALRVDKVILAAAEQTLRDRLMGVVTPVHAMLERDAADLASHAKVLVGALAAAGVEGVVQAGTSLVGGGSMPGEGLPTSLVVIDHPHPDRLAKQLRQGEPSIVARVSKGALQFDVRTLHASHTEVIVGQVSALLAEGI